MPGFRIHDQLLSDCHRIGRFDISHVLLHRNAAVPWFVLVPETEVRELLDLPEGDRNLALKEAAIIAQFIKRELRYPKINFAAIGNVVSQLHLHIVGRREDDLCWPKPVWGNLNVFWEYSASRLREIAELLAQRYSLRRTP
ncbi:MAG TPA: HIT family protein [Candidatus Acidoferrales bacterium]|nr:HIT family protein [Candidatus Acidoferrales bacterium]